MQAVVEIKGKQYLVAAGSRIRVATFPDEAGKIITIPSVIMTMDGKKIATGKTGQVVKAKVVAHGLGEKIRIFKHHAKKRYRRTAGLRQGYTELHIESTEAAK